MDWWILVFYPEPEWIYLANIFYHSVWVALGKQEICLSNCRSQITKESEYSGTCLNQTSLGPAFRIDR
jgi:hypothetical protein